MMDKEVEITGNEISECCKKKENRIEQPSDKPGELKIEKCGECGRRHYTLYAEAIKLGLELKSLKS